MVVTILVPRMLRDDVGGASTLELDVQPGAGPRPGEESAGSPKATLAEVLDVLAVRHPRLERRLRDEQGSLRRYVNIYVDGEECRLSGGAITPIRDGTEIQVIPSVAGG